MNKNQKVILILILFIILVIILLLGGMLILSKKNNNIDDDNKIITGNSIIKNEIENTELENNIYYNDEWNKESNKINNKITYVTNRTDYFTIKALTENYINSIGNEEKEILLNILSPLYKSKYNINNNNVFDIITIPKLTDYKQYYKTTITEITTAEITNQISIYIVKGNCRIVGKDEKFTIQVMLEVDTVNNLYNVYPYQYIKDNNFDKLNVGNTINYEAQEIKENEYNKFNYVTKTDIEMAKEYFNNYNELLMYYQDEAYNMLNQEYSNKRFGSKESFQEYIKANAKTLYLMQIDKYKIVSNDNYTDYICSDKYENIYIFRQEEGIMKYTAFLDNYTVMIDEYAEKYNGLDKFDKAKYNLTKFINMVNTKDYNAIYNVLDTTFRTNNSKTRDDLKQFIQGNMYDLNSLSIIDVDDKTYEYYVFSCKITNMRNSNESKNMTVIINQTEGTDFTMSFSFE